MITYLFIPSFIRDQLTRNNLPLSKIKDFETVKRLFSINDIALLVQLAKQDNTNKILSPFKTQESSVYICSDILNYWNKYLVKNQEVSQDFFKNLNVLVDSGQAQKELVERLFKTETPAIEADKKYEITDIGDQCYGVIVYPDVFPNSIYCKELIRDMIGVMYCYKRIDEIAREEDLFKHYVNQLC